MRSNSRNLNASGKRQRGVATLLTAVVLLVAIFLVSYNMSETVISDKRNVATAVRASQAFQRAHSGLDCALTYLKGEGLQSAVSLATASGATLVATADYACTDSLTTVVFTEYEDYIEISSTAFSDDQSVRRVVKDRISGSPVTSGPPSVPVVSKGAVGISKGNVSVTNNYEPLTIWSGDAAELGSSTTTYISIDGVEDQISNSATTRGPDIVDDDANLANATEEEFLQAFFNISQLNQFCGDGNATCSDEDGDNTYYFEPSGSETDDGGTCEDDTYTQVRLSDYTTSPTNPVLIVVDGGAEIFFGGGGTFYGMIIAQEVMFSGGMNPSDSLQGSIIAIDCVNDNGTGGGRIELNPTVITDLSGTGQTVRLAGGWHDW